MERILEAYKVYETMKLSDLELIVNLSIINGWVCQGGIARHDKYFYQAMVKYKK